MNADDALETLIKGNMRFVTGAIAESGARRDIRAARKALAHEQHPFAVIVGCSDSRVSPSSLFDTHIGDLFEIRTAGQVVGPLELGSIQYAVEHLHTELVVVLGHERCGAVTAAVEGGEAPGAIWDVVAAIRPAVEASADMRGDPVENAVRQNALNVAEALRADPILADAIAAGELKIVAGRYDLDIGRVSLK